MKSWITMVIRMFSVAIVFTVFEFALPLTIHTAEAKNFVAKRDRLHVRMMTTQAPDRDVCDIKTCGPVYRVVRTSAIHVTAYSSTPDQTSGDPFITASGLRVHNGTFAINGLPFGTKLRIPDYFGDKIFIVEDRMSARYSSNRGDIWMETRQEAINWGVRRVRIEIIEEVI